MTTHLQIPTGLLQIAHCYSVFNPSDRHELLNQIRDIVALRHFSKCCTRLCDFRVLKEFSPILRRMIVHIAQVSLVRISRN